MSFKIEKGLLRDVIIIRPKVFFDSRGFFYESFNLNDFRNNTGLNINFVQDNHSQSKKGVLRGLHYQIIKPQTKLVSVLKGKVYDVCVDLRKHSPDFGKSMAIILSDENKTQLLIPEGFAHGFLTLEDNTDFIYKTTEYRYQEYERVLKWNDPKLKINWPNLNTPYALNERDLLGVSLKKCDIFE